MIVEFIKPFGDLVPGSITDKFSDGICRTLIEEGTAKPSTEIAQAMAAFTADSDRRQKEQLEAIRAIHQGGRGKPTGPPGGKELNDALNLDSVTTSEPVYEQGKKHFSDVLRCIHAVGSKGAPSEIVEYASNRLRHVYSNERVDYKLNPQTGKMDSIITRHLDDGGTEVITRTGTDSLGGGATYGFTVKPEYLGDLFRIARDQEVFASSTRKIPVTSGLEVKYPALGQYSAPTNVGGLQMSAVFGGISLAYKGETSARSETDAITEEIDFKIVDLTGATSYSRDYIVDNFIAMDAIVTGLFGEAMAWQEDWVTIWGNGVGMPQGFMNSAATLRTSRAGGANTICSADLGTMMSKLSSQCWKGARWITNVSCIPQLFILNNSSGTPVFQPNALIAQNDPLSIMQGSSSDGRVNRPMGSLIGLPVYFSEKASILGTAGDLMLVCPDQYGLAERLGLEIGVSEHFYFSTDKIAYRFKKRHDGRSLWRAPYIQADNRSTPGSGTQVSPFNFLV